MRSCDVRGVGPGVSKDYGNALWGGGVAIHGDHATGDFYNVSFTDLHAGFGSAFWVGESSDDGVESSVRFFGCQILRNSAADGGAVFVIGWDFVRAEIHDCLFANNPGTALLDWFSGDMRIVRCTFRENTGSPIFPFYGSAVVIHSVASKLVSISDSLFERNISPEESDNGGALTLAQGHMVLTNVSFLANTAFSVLGGAALDVRKGAKVTMMNCFALGNVANGNHVLAVADSELEVINCECQCVGGGRVAACVFPSSILLSWRTSGAGPNRAFSHFCPPSSLLRVSIFQCSLALLST
jgi:hypothetical protein